MNLPCKTDKCISYPVCISKKEIHCSKLHSYFRITEDKIGEGTGSTWKYIHNTFPNLHLISFDHIPYSDYINRF